MIAAVRIVRTDALFHSATRFRNEARFRRAISAPLSALLLLAAMGFTSAPALAREPAPSASELLENLNTDFRALYRQRTQEVLEALPLVLVVQNNTITAVRGTQRKLYPVPIQRYNEARAIIHTLLAFHGVASSLADEQTAARGGSAEYWAQLEALSQDLQQVRRAVSQTTLTRAEQAHARKVLDVLEDASRYMLSTRSVTSSWLADTLRRTQQPLAALTDSVGRAHADAMQATLKRIQSDATAQEWENVVAVVTGPMTPRRNNLETAIVASVLGSEHLGTRIFYSENIFSVDGALTFLQTLVGDRELSENVFDQPHRMWEDLFAPVSASLVEEDFYTELAN